MNGGWLVYLVTFRDVGFLMVIYWPLSSSILHNGLTSKNTYAAIHPHFATFLEQSLG